MRMGFWPREARGAQLSIETRHRASLAMLFARQAWQLPVGGPPRPEARPNTGASLALDPDDRKPASAAWLSRWSRVHEDDRSFREVVEDLGSAGRTLDLAAFDRWRDSLIPRGKVIPHRYQPETLAADAVTSAWERGLRSLIVLPLGRHWAEWRGERVLMLADVTRGDLDAYLRALATRA